MSVTITNKTASIELYSGAVLIRSMDKDSLVIKRVSDLRISFIQNNGVATLINYSDITAPASADIDALMVILAGYQSIEAGAVTIQDDSGNPINAVPNADGNFHLRSSIIQSIITSAGNTTTDNLTTGATFTGTAEATFGINGIQIYHNADQNCTIYLDQGIDGTTYDVVDYWAVEADEAFTTTVTSVAPYFRIRVTNTSGSSTTSLVTAAGMTPIINPLPRALSSTGRLKVETEDSFQEIPAGRIRGHSAVNKFGENSNIAQDTQEDIWDGGGDYVFPTTASITHLRSAVNSAITRNVVCEVQGLDTNYALVVQNVTTDVTNSTTEVALGTALRRVFRIKILDANVMDEDIWVGATGVSAATAKAIVMEGNNQTLMAIYTVPAGKTAYMTNFYASVTEATGKEPKGANIRLWAADRNNGYAFQLKHSVGIQKGASGVEHKYMPYNKFTEKTDIKISGNPFNEAGWISAGFDLILVDN